MAVFSLPASRSRATTLYNSFRGVDFSGDTTKIDNTRSPYAPNLISDSGGYPQKRTGWRSLKKLSGAVNGLFHTVLDGNEYWLAHVGSGLYLWDPDSNAAPSLLRSGLNNALSWGFEAKGYYYLLTGREYLRFDGQFVTPVKQVARIPTVTISRTPTGGGRVYESVNLLSPYRTDSFLCDGVSTSYYLSATEVTEITGVLLDGEACELSYTLDGERGCVTFASAPPAPAVTGQDNLLITYEKPVTGYQERIEGCRFGTQYGIGGADYWFFSGNADYPNLDFCSALQDPTYFPDLGYAGIGGEGSAVTGYARFGEYLAILKEDQAQDATVFLRVAQDTPEGVLFPLRQGISGVGSVSARSVGSVRDEPLFLSRRGIYAITTSAITAQRSVQNRSYFIDPVLCKEEHLEEAVAVNWEGRYLLCVGSNCYVLDGSQKKAYRSQSENDYVYECFHWNNIPARCFLEVNGALFFGTDDGKICRFNNDLEGVAQYHDDGEPIRCQWSTKADDDGDFLRQKTLLPRGLAIQIRPYERGSVEVLLRTEREEESNVLSQVTDIFSFDRVHFDRFVFNATDSPQVIPIHASCRGYLTLQIIVRNNGLYEGLGVLGIIKRFSVGRNRR
ncbi:MAG: hypothetical protein IJG56_02460 [Clostridia bacterium]|nr:hypothetical protein [Clostridia bacterium]